MTTVAMFAMHGAIYLMMKTEGELHDRIDRAVPRLMVVFFVLNTLVVIAMVAVRPAHHGALRRRHLAGRSSRPPRSSRSSAPGCCVRRGEPFRRVPRSSAMIALLLISGGIGLYPNLLISTTDPAYNLTIYNAASAENTLEVTLIVAVIGMPFVLLYTAGVYYIFRGKTVVDADGY